MKTEKSIQFLSNNRKLIAGPCKKQFFLSFHLFYYIHTPVPPLSQANQSDGNSVAREVEFDHHLTTSSPQPVPLIVCTLQHSFITTTNNAESCAHYTISGAVSWHLPARHSSPTRKAAGSNPVSRTTQTPCWKAGRFSFVQPSGKLHPVRHRGRKQHVRPVSVPAGSNSPADCWKVRGSRWSPDGGMGAVHHPLRGGIMHRANARIRLAGKSLNTLRRSVFFTRPLAHQKKPYGNVRLFLFYGLFGCIRPEPQDAPAAPVRNGDKNRSRCWSPGGR